MAFDYNKCVSILFSNFVLLIYFEYKMTNLQVLEKSIKKEKQNKSKNLEHMKGLNTYKMVKYILIF